MTTLTYQSAYGLHGLSADQLVRLIQKGDGQAVTAFDCLMQRYHGLIESVAWQVTGDHDLAEDCSAMARTRLWSALSNGKGEKGTYKPGTNFRAWLGRVVTNAGRDLVKKRGKRTARIEPIVDEDPEDDITEYDPSLHLSSPLPFPPEVAEYNETVRTLNRLLRQLSLDHRKVLLLCVQGWSYEEMARMLRIPLGTVQSRLHYARYHLERLAYEDGLIPEIARTKPHWSSRSRAKAQRALAHL